MIRVKTSVENMIAEKLIMFKIIRFIGIILLFITLIIGLIFVLTPFLIAHFVWNWADSKIERIENEDDKCCRNSLWY